MIKWIYSYPQIEITERILKNHYSREFSLKECHQFLAGDALKSRSRDAALDETAVLGTVCRHNFPQRFISMKHGERYGDLLLVS